MLAKRLSVVSSVLVIPLSYALLRMGDQNLRYAAVYEFSKQTEGLPYFEDVVFGIFVVAPAAIGITVGLFWRFREQRTLANVMTVFSGVFGVLACLYFLWTLRY